MYILIEEGTSCYLHSHTLWRAFLRKTIHIFLFFCTATDQLFTTYIFSNLLFLCFYSNWRPSILTYTLLLGVKNVSNAYITYHLKHFNDSYGFPLMNCISLYIIKSTLHTLVNTPEANLQSTAVLHSSCRWHDYTGGSSIELAVLQKLFRTSVWQHAFLPSLNN